jgi:hypothetical protein
LIVETRRFEAIAGKVSADGLRDGRDAALNVHFAPLEAASILEEAAHLANAKGNLRDALQLLNLAGRYDELLELLNKQLVTQLDKLATSEERK